MSENLFPIIQNQIRSGVSSGISIAGSWNSENWQERQILSNVSDHVEMAELPDWTTCLLEWCRSSMLLHVYFNQD